MILMKAVPKKIIVKKLKEKLNMKMEKPLLRDIIFTISKKFLRKQDRGLMIW